VVDLAIPCHDGTLAIVLGDRPGPPGSLRFSSGDLPPGGLEAVIQAIERLGGVHPSG